MKHSMYLFKSIAIISICISTSNSYAITADYLTNFKIPVQQTFCISKSAGGDMNIYKKCMLAIEKGAYKCDKDAKVAYDQLFKKFSNFGRNASEVMDNLRPITEKHFECLNTLY